jgi:hypothetical protein
MGGLKQETATGLKTAARAGAMLVRLTFAECVRIGLPPENDFTNRSTQQSIPTGTSFVSAIFEIRKILQYLYSWSSRRTPGMLVCR